VKVGTSVAIKDDFRPDDRQIGRLLALTPGMVRAVRNRQVHPQRCKDATCRHTRVSSAPRSPNGPCRTTSAGDRNWSPPMSPGLEVAQIGHARHGGLVSQHWRVQPLLTCIPMPDIMKELRKPRPKCQ
jgi:hypothetical protein